MNARHWSIYGVFVNQSGCLGRFPGVLPDWFWEMRAEYQTTPFVVEMFRSRIPWMTREGHITKFVNMADYSVRHKVFHDETTHPTELEFLLERNDRLKGC